MADSYWWCDCCEKRIDPHDVKYDETHEGCGSRVRSIDESPQVDPRDAELARLRARVTELEAELATALKHRRIPGTDTGSKDSPVPPITDPIIRCDKCGTAYPNDGENRLGLCGSCSEGHNELVSREAAARIINHHQDYIVAAEGRLDSLRREISAVISARDAATTIAERAEHRAAQYESDIDRLRAELATAREDRPDLVCDAHGHPPREPHAGDGCDFWGDGSCTGHFVDRALAKKGGA